MHGHTETQTDTQTDTRGTELPSSVIEVARYLVRRRLGRAALLFLAAHQPIVFLVGQGLYFLSPVYRLLTANTASERALDEWARLCSQPEGLQQLESLLLADSARVDLISTDLVQTEHTQSRS